MTEAGTERLTFIEKFLELQLSDSLAEHLDDFYLAREARGILEYA